MHEELQRTVQLQCETAKAVAMDLARRAEEAATSKPAVAETLRNASRKHFTVSTILYATLCVAKVEDLESLLSEDSDQQSSRAHFDMEQYRHTLESARQWRMLESKRAANSMFSSEFVQVFMQNLEDLKNQLVETEVANRRELVEFGDSLRLFRRDVTATQESLEVARDSSVERRMDGASSRELLKVQKETIEKLQEEYRQLQKSKAEEIECYIHSLQETETMLETSTKTIQRLEELYDALQREFTTHNSTEERRAIGEIDKLKSEIAMTTLAKEEAERKTAIREQERTALEFELKKNQMSSSTLGDRVIELEEDKKRLTESLKEAFAKVDRLESDLSKQQQVVVGPTAVKAALHAKNSAIEEKDEALVHLERVKARIESELEASQKLVLAREVQAEQLAKELEDVKANLSRVSRALELAQVALSQQFDEKELQVMARAASLSNAELGLIVKVQAVARRVIAKSLVNMIRLAKRAREEDILIAVKPTAQGDTGWYMHPDQSIYHFTLTGAGETSSWAQTTPPLTPTDWKEVVKIVESKKPSTTSRMLSPYTQTAVLHPSSGKILPNVYMENGTRALFVVRSIDSVSTYN